MAHAMAELAKQVWQPADMSAGTAKAVFYRSDFSSPWGRLRPAFKVFWMIMTGPVSSPSFKVDWLRT